MLRIKDDNGHHSPALPCSNCPYRAQIEWHAGTWQRGILRQLIPRQGEIEVRQLLGDGPCIGLRFGVRLHFKNQAIANSPNGQKSGTGLFAHI